MIFSFFNVCVEKYSELNDRDMVSAKAGYILPYLKLVENMLMSLPGIISIYGAVAIINTAVSRSPFRVERV